MTQPIRTIRIAAQGPAGPAGLYPQAQWSAGQVPYVRNTVLTHNSRLWLALRDNSVEPATGVPDDWASWFDFNGIISGLATLDESGKIPAAQLPAIAITDTYAAASEAAMLALAAQKGDIAIRSDLNKSFVLAAEPASVLANWRELLTPTDAVLSVAGLTGGIGASALKGALAISSTDISGLGALAVLNVGAGLSSGAGSLSANVTSVAGKTGAVTLASSDISGLAASATTDATNAGNITAGILNNARLSGVALTANNLADLANAAIAAGNLGLGSSNAVTHKSATLTGGTITANAPALDATQTWNSGATTFYALKSTITDTASAALSRLLSLNVGAAEKAGIIKDGSFFSASGFWSTAAGTLGGSANTGFWYQGTSHLFYSNGVNAFKIGSGGVYLGPVGMAGWAETGSANGTIDTNISRNAAGVLQIGTTAANALGSLLLAGLTASGVVKMTGLPTSNPGVAGQLWNNGGVLTVSAG